MQLGRRGSEASGSIRLISLEVGKFAEGVFLGENGEQKEQWSKGTMSEGETQSRGARDRRLQRQSNTLFGGLRTKPAVSMPT